jgi:hypothetical protein
MSSSSFKSWVIRTGCLDYSAIVFVKPVRGLWCLNHAAVFLKSLGIIEAFLENPIIN